MATPVGSSINPTYEKLRAARSKYRRDYYLKNKNKLKAASREYHLAHRHEITARNRAARKADPIPHRERSRKWREANRDKIKASYLKGVARKRERRLGVTQSAFEAILSSQSNRCAICRSDTPGRRTSWHLDHDHNTGVVRGILCSSCNLGIGQLRDDPYVVMEAAAYLLKHKTGRKVG